MITLDKLIAELEIARDNGHTAVVVQIGHDTRAAVNTVTPWLDNAILIGNRPAANAPNMNHTNVGDARISDDLRKLIYAHASFRKACVEFANARNLRYDPADPDRFKRLRAQVIETGRDIMHIMSHIESDIR